MSIIAGEDKIEGMSQSPVNPDIEKLKAVFPQCFAEGKLDIDQLLNLCGEYIDNDFEKFKFEWKGKGASLKLAQKPSLATLRPKREESVSFDNTHNLYIKGDNLEVLKLIQRAYFGQVKMIYIDPPYNTGNDFIYDDDFKDPLARYKEVTSQTTKSNPETMGRFHTAWLNMIYPRLRLAQTLLRDDGVIFISIDDHGVHNLRKVCDEVFGEENFRNVFILKRYDKNINSQFVQDGLVSFNTGFEYVLCYAKSSKFKFNPVYREASEKRQAAGYWKGFWNNADRPTMRYDILDFTPNEGQWKWSKEKAEEAIANYVDYLENHSSISLEEYWRKTGCTKKFIRRNPSGKGKNMGVEHWIPPTENILRNTNWLDHFASKPLEDFKGAFDFPKNPEAIKVLLESSTSENDIILDFFAGSSTTAHAVMDLNAQDGGNRKFIMVQLPELCDEKSEAYKAGYKTICDIGIERIRRAGAQIKKKHKADDLLIRGQPLDTGFRVLELDSSNFPIWDESPIDPNALDVKEQLRMRFDHVLRGVNPEHSHQDIIFEIMLKYGWPLDLKIYPLPINGKKFYYIGEREGDVLAIIAIDPPFEPEDAEEMIKYLPVKIVALDAAFEGDEALINCDFIFKDNEVSFDKI
ncbi:site-specific DNA-methyltransferase [Bartonella krasnovii]|uniref:site-specific DNA-methyltransferase n=1 Tax=Bartonella krasnovii TaxID=2267275 RepID=UPI001F4C774D|nr:site-specific DNA-methyltransferase [Bartonella krasnovii]UNF37363.1 site-specific DNA-methyltransferase [Bartonella krasnovii]